jgi:hypothetical protein
MARGVIKKKSTMYPESRNVRRYLVKVRFSGASKTAIRGDLHDVSPTGLCLSTTTDVERGKVLHLEFELPTGPVELVAEVRWVTPRKEGQFELGLRIVRIAEASLQAIRDATTERNRTSRPLRLPVAT